MAETMQTLEDLSSLKTAAPAEAPRYVQKLDKQGRSYATGKRKDAVARVWVKPGAGKIVINDRPVETYDAAKGPAMPWPRSSTTTPSSAPRVAACVTARAPGTDIPAAGRIGRGARRWRCRTAWRARWPSARRATTASRG